MITYEYFTLPRDGNVVVFRLPVDAKDGTPAQLIDVCENDAEADKVLTDVMAATATLAQYGIPT